MKIFSTFILFIGLMHFLGAQEISQKVIDWQGHRGARGLAPENAVPAFIKALSFSSITTLELDVVISADGKVVVSHEPWLNPKICFDTNGKPIKGNEKINLYRMAYNEIKKCDCGSQGNPSFPEQKAEFAYKPLLSEVIKEVSRYCKDSKRPLPQFNIEIKSNPSSDGIFTSEVEVFADIVRKEIKKLKLEQNICVQSFDPRALRYLHDKEKEWVLAYLVEKAEDVQQQIRELGFKPTIYSPHFEKVSKAIVDDCHQLGMKIIPWTVNEMAQMEKLVKFGVDGIITDYPNRIPLLSN